MRQDNPDSEDIVQIHRSNVCFRDLSHAKKVRRDIVEDYPDPYPDDPYCLVYSGLRTNPLTEHYPAAPL